jgi:hypothetical protein
MRALFFLALALSGHAASLKIVVMRDFGTTPIADVELRLARSNAPMTFWTARTDVDGAARFDNLAAGSYFLETTCEGYLDSKVTGGGQTVQLKEGATAEVTLRLTASTTLEGHVVDESGRPMAGVLVHSTWVESTTDVEGRFRLANVRAGACLIDFRIPADLREKALTRDAETGAALGYPAVEYYPGVTDVAAAVNIQAAGGMDLRGIDVRLRRVPLADFIGQTLERAGVPLTGVTVELQTPGDKNPQYDESLNARAVDGEGRFRFERIPPGAYVLLVYRGENGGGLPSMMPIEVARNSTREKAIVVPRSQTIRGVLRVEDNVEWSGEVTVRLATDQKGVTDREVRMRRSGEFVLEDIPTGEWRISAQTSQTTFRRSDRRKLMITSARFGTTDAITSPITVVESGNPLLELELSTASGRIAGKITGGGVSVLMVERMGAVRWYVSSSPFLRTNPDGTFITDELAPGTYAVQGAGKPVRVEVKAGETTTVQLDSPPVRKSQ